MLYAELNNFLGEAAPDIHAMSKTLYAGFRTYQAQLSRLDTVEEPFSQPSDKSPKSALLKMRHVRAPPGVPYATIVARPINASRRPSLTDPLLSSIQD
mmetsp:Transcript_54756/g.66002  ORF Transcript_54756/g.66002 Transcript_54756/m.66002 type:complete len:98 (+) Transcript_54756:122-415(+)